MRIFQRVFLLAAAAAAAVTLSAPAHAFGIGVRAGTTGFGGDVGWRIAPATSVRLGYSALDWEHDVTTSDVRYDGRLKLSNLSGLVDFHPIGPLFRLTGGLVYNGTKYDATGQPTGGTFTLGGRTYAASDVGSLAGTVKPGRSLAPYLGVGYGNVAGAGLNFYFDVGVIFQGRPRADLNAACGPALSASACAQLQSDVEAEEARLRDELRRLRYYPVLNLGLTIGF
jgi:hypothetical protein